MKVMKKALAVLLALALMLALLSGCGDGAPAGDGGDSSSGAASGGEDGAAAQDGAEDGSQSAGNGEVTWSWGNFRGLYGDAEVTFNEDGGRDTVLMKYPNGALYRKIQYNYGADVGAGDVIISGKEVYPAEKITYNAAGSELYSYYYSWALCELEAQHWGAGAASDITPIMEAGEALDAGETPELPEERYFSSYESGYNYEKEESSGSTEYQEMSHLMVKGNSYQATYEYGGGYWLTKRVDGDPAKTWFYAADGRLDEDLTLTWHYKDGKPLDVQEGQYASHTYIAEVSDDGLTVTYTRDESHSNEDDSGNKKDLTQVYTLVVSKGEDGKPAMYKHTSYKEYLNSDEPKDDEYSITYQYGENGALSGAVYQTPDTTYTITCNSDGLLATEDNLKKSLGSGDIGAKAYTYYASGALESVAYYGDFTTEDPAEIDHIDKFNENGGLSMVTNYENGIVNYELTYYEDGKPSGATYYTDEGNVYEKYTRDEKGMYTSYEYYNSDGKLIRSGEMTGENEFTVYYRDGESKQIRQKYISHEDEYELVSYNDDGTENYRNTHSYDKIIAP